MIRPQDTKEIAAALKVYDAHGGVKPPLASAHGSVVWKACGIKRDMSGISTLTIEYVRPMTLAEVVADVERRHPDLRSISAAPQNGESTGGGQR